MLTLPRSERFVSPYLPVYAGIALAAGTWLGDRWLASGFFACAGETLAPSPHWLLAPLPLLLLLIVWGRHHRRVLVPALVAAMALLGIWRYLEHPFTPCWGPYDLAYYHAEEAFSRPSVIEGVVSSYPDVQSASARYQVEVDSLWRGAVRLPVTGALRLSIDSERDFAYGDRLQIRGVLAPASDAAGTAFARNLAAQGVFTVVRRPEAAWLASGQGKPWLAALYGVRSWASDMINALLPQPYAALANGIILGLEGDIPSSLMNAFRVTGTLHVLVISGANIAVLAGFMLVATRWMFRGRAGPAAVCTLAVILLYTLLVGAEPPVVRAALMGAIAVVGVSLNRTSSGLISLFLVGAIMILLNPLWLWHLSFQLSFMATLGLVLFSAPLQQRWRSGPGQRLPRRVNGLLVEGFLVTLAAQMTTLPLLILYFGQLSLVSLLANLLVLPVQALILLGGLPTIAVALFFPALGQLLAYIPQTGLWWTTLIVERLAALRFASVEIGPFGKLMAGVYLALFAAGFLFWLFRQEQEAQAIVPEGLRRPLVWGITAAVLVTAPAWMAATVRESSPDGRLHLYILGQQETAAFLIVTPEGHRVLVDPLQPGSGHPLGDLLDQLPGKGSLDLVIQTRPGGSASSSPPATEVMTADHPTLRPGATVQLDADTSLVLVHAPEDAADSALYLLRYHDFTTLLPLDQSQTIQAALKDDFDAAVTLLPAPFPGTGAWPNPALIAALHPQQTLVPAGVTYPPSATRALAVHSLTTTIPNDAAVAITSDGATFDVTVHPYESLR